MKRIKTKKIAKIKKIRTKKAPTVQVPKIVMTNLFYKTNPFVYSNLTFN